VEPDQLDHQSAAGHQVTLTARANTWFCRRCLNLPSELSWHGLPPALQRHPLNSYPCGSPGAPSPGTTSTLAYEVSHCPEPGLVAPPIKPVDPTEETGDALHFQTSAVSPAAGEEAARTKRQPIRHRFHRDLHGETATLSLPGKEQGQP